MIQAPFCVFYMYYLVEPSLLHWNNICVWSGVLHSQEDVEYVWREAVASPSLSFKSGIGL